MPRHKQHQCSTVKRVPKDVWSVGAALLLLGVSSCGLRAQDTPAQSSNPTPAQPASAQAAPAAPALKPGYAGSDACKLCHEDLYNRFTKSLHFALETNHSRGWAGMACESCHGPGAKHAESTDPKDIRLPTKLPVVEADDTCLGCHRNQKEIGRIASSHAKDTIACYQCHSVHGAGGKPLLLTKISDITAQCAGCHLSVWASFEKPYKHRVVEGAMSCVDCHNPHSSFTPESMRTAFGNEPTCFRCHSDKRGPFVFEHAPVRFEGCMACHEPHGSENPRMLIRHEVRLVCLDCHANSAPLPATVAGAKTAHLPYLGQIPPAFHDLRSPRFQNCTICHVKIHGSYVDSFLER